MSLSRLERLLAGVALTIPAVEYAFYQNTAPHTSAERVVGTAQPLIYDERITPHVGDFPESFAMPALSGLIGDYIAAVGYRSGSRSLQATGRYFPELVTGATALYFTLGETVLPQILPGNADSKDVPAVLVSALAGYALAKLGRKTELQRHLAKAGQSI